MTKPPAQLAEEVREQVKDRTSYLGVIDRLNKASVDKHWEAYADIPWEDPEFQVDPDDPRWVMSPALDPLAQTEWYKAQPAEVQSQIGLWRVATAMKVGLQFENLLKRGLLNYAYWLPNGRPEFRYVYHETTEECNHGMMFQEFVNRTKMPIRGMPKSLTTLAQVAPWIPLISTELFFVFVLGGEDPIDFVQRKSLKGGHIKHPLEETIMKIHIAEEARHISFARHYLKHRVPNLSKAEKRMLGLLAPVVLGVMARIMLCPPGPMVRHFDIPREVVKEAYGSPEFKQQLRDCVGKIRDLMAELDLITPVNKQVWAALGIWDKPRTRSVAGRAAKAA
ncbi:AurF N-oxygenase family protein [Thermomonospora umbrina]|uniref:Para-aminobenzoate N-oxygenase AurF n=1 Tax=Thermomonospora umbrina TaxID=111806 RepID=A0A3D9SI35_9ACTN|nr:diiron oxygenase [Thermomonospora umbrina]REE95562.1 para-aminobenzoate N-oxygenase AurF [Thermomonospora umbrina]